MPQRRRRPRVNRHFKIDHTLSPDDREAYLAFLREPRNTIDLAHAWLAGKGYRALSRSAVARHRRHYLETYQRRPPPRRRRRSASRRSGAFARSWTSPTRRAGRTPPHRRQPRIRAITNAQAGGAV